MSDFLPYDSFDDPHLQTYFQNRNLRKHLRKIGLINRSGQRIPEKEYQSRINERSRQEHARTLLAQGIVQRVIQLENIRQANLNNYLQATNKRMIVENIQKSRKQSRPLCSNDYISLDRPQTSVKNRSHLQYKQAKIIDRIPSRVSTRTYLSNRSSTPKISSKPLPKDRCQIRMIYLGGQSKVDFNQNKADEILLMQQHCGGENLLLYKNLLKPNEEFQFESHRHEDYPFALTFYVNGLIDCRISVCCEYKHRIGVPLGGKRASFSILNVQGRQPCLTCRFNEHIARSPLFRPTSITTGTSDSSTKHRLLRTPSPEDCSTIVDDHQQAKEFYENLTKKLENDLNWEEQVHLHIQLANICKEGLVDYDQALEHYLISIEISCQHLSPFDRKLRNNYLNIAHLLLLRQRNETNLAIEYFQRILQIDSSTDDRNLMNLINDHHYLGLLYQNQSDYKRSLLHLQKSLQFYLKLDHSNIPTDLPSTSSPQIHQTIYDQKADESLSIGKLPNLSEIYFHLAITHQNLQEKTIALKYAQKALELSHEDQHKFDIYHKYINQLRQS